MVLFHLIELFFGRVLLSVCEARSFAPVSHFCFFHFFYKTYSQVYFYWGVQNEIGQFCKGSVGHGAGGSGESVSGEVWGVGSGGWWFIVCVWGVDRTGGT